MKINSQKVLNKYHVVFLAQSMMIGTGPLALPQQLSHLGYSQAFFPIIMGVVASFTLWPMVWLSSKFPNETLFSIIEILLGKWLGKCINALIVLQFIVFTAGNISDFMIIIESSVLTRQAIWIPILIILLLFLYIVKGGIKSVANFCILTFFVSIFMLFFLKWALEEGEVRHLLPVFNFTGNEFLNALKQGYVSLVGYELIMFYFPYIINQKNAYKHALIGIWISTGIFLVVTITSVMYLSLWQLENVKFSVLSLYKAGGFSFIERIDVFGITLWVFHILCAVSGYIWCAKKGMESIMSKKAKYYLIILTMATFFIVNMPVSQEFQKKLYLGSSYIGYMIIVSPIFLSLVYLIRKKKVQQCTENF
ncbi:GerAB/ArcD/ProY family transporter [Lysinibacillus fusiformis]|uniref:GerAB/ArcD/ProY family transporter n=1 Tax=Lysinibacillus fusiformis TaxID=28031 RepID=UPI001245EEB2|nr:GerAB/ArcD/ProY family transporter [Lysinibacillus fusiformis]KAB0442142.1 spore gernimation protein [Lysinibacillus fusiformis]